MRARLGTTAHFRVRQYCIPWACVAFWGEVETSRVGPVRDKQARPVVKALAVWPAQKEIHGGLAG